MESAEMVLYTIPPFAKYESKGNKLFETLFTPLNHKKILYLQML